MPLFENNLSPYLTIVEATEPAAPAAGQQRVYIDSTTHLLKRTDSSGGDVTIEGLTNPMSAVGDTIQGTVAGAPARLAAPLAGKVLTGAGVTTPMVYAYPPGYELDYVENTAGNTDITATTEATANTFVTGSAVAYDGSTAVIIECFSPELRPGAAAADNISLYLYDGASSIGLIGFHLSSAAAPENHSMLVRRRLTPSNATHTYSIRAAVSTGTGRFTTGAGGNAAIMPGYIRITKV
jgi:hypothetical protein